VSDVVVVADLLDAGTPVPAPGPMHVIGLMRYSVVEVIEGGPVAPLILVGHSGADPAAPAFRPGTRQRLTLTRAFPDGASVVAPFPTAGTEAYYCLAYTVV
jgi:hypothetical protein